VSRIDHIGTGEARLHTSGVSADELRRHNLAAVLERLHFHGPLTRSAITTITGLNRSTVGDLIGQLTDLGLAFEGPGVAAVGPGRPSPIVRVRSSGAIALAIELDVDSIAVGTIGLGGHIYNRLRVARPRRHASPEDAIRDVVKLAGPLLGSLPADHAFVGVGVGVAGITRRSDGFVHLAPNLGWVDVPVGTMLAEALGLGGPVLVANEADLGAVGEHRRGVRPGVRHLVYISGEVGIGAGVIVDGKLLHGKAGYAGEAGHTVINPGGHPCRCGSVGCWETEAGEAALLRQIKAPEGAGGAAALDDVRRRALAGDPVTVRAVEGIGGWLGLGISNLINIFNPEVVVLGGLYERLFSVLEPPVAAAVRTHTLQAPGAMVEIVGSGLGNDAPLLGAAESVLARVIVDPAAALATPGRAIPAS